jgi:hypothetical protein
MLRYLALFVDIVENLGYRLVGTAVGKTKKREWLALLAEGRVRGWFWADFVAPVAVAPRPGPGEA